LVERRRCQHHCGFLSTHWCEGRLKLCARFQRARLRESWRRPKLPRWPRFLSDETPTSCDVRSRFGRGRKSHWCGSFQWRRVPDRICQQTFMGCRWRSRELGFKLHGTPRWGGLFAYGLLRLLGDDSRSSKSADRGQRRLLFSERFEEKSREHSFLELCCKLPAQGI
jgi:hypothetical protein